MGKEGWEEMVPCEQPMISSHMLFHFYWNKMFAQEKKKKS